MTPLQKHVASVLADSPAREEERGAYLESIRPWQRRVQALVDQGVPRSEAVLSSHPPQAVWALHALHVRQVAAITADLINATRPEGITIEDALQEGALLFLEALSAYDGRVSLGSFLTLRFWSLLRDWIESPVGGNIRWDGLYDELSDDYETPTHDTGDWQSTLDALAGEIDPERWERLMGRGGDELRDPPSRL